MDINSIVSNALVGALKDAGVMAVRANKTSLRYGTHWIAMTTRSYPKEIRKIPDLAKWLIEQYSDFCIDRFYIAGVEIEKNFLHFSAIIDGKPLDLLGCAGWDTFVYEPSPEGDDFPQDGFVNRSPHKFTDISSEQSRVYNFGSKGFVKIENPKRLSVSSSGGHRIYSADGKSHYIPAGWIHLSWTARPNEANFVQ